MVMVANYVSLGAYSFKSVYVTAVSLIRPSLFIYPDDFIC